MQLRAHKHLQKKYNVKEIAKLGLFHNSFYFQYIGPTCPMPAGPISSNLQYYSGPKNNRPEYQNSTKHKMIQINIKNI